MLNPSVRENILHGQTRLSLREEERHGKRIFPRDVGDMPYALGTHQVRIIMRTAGLSRGAGARHPGPEGAGPLTGKEKEMDDFRQRIGR